MNAAIQCIAYTPQLRQVVLANYSFHPLYTELARLIAALGSAPSPAIVAPKAFVAEAYRSLPTVLTPPFTQQDVCEFVMAVLDLGSKPVVLSKTQDLPTEMDTMICKIQTFYADHAKAASPFSQCMMTQSIRQTRCGSCGKKAHNFEHSNVIILPSHASSIQHGIDHVFATEVLGTAWQCDKCKARSPSSSVTHRLTMLPQTIAFAINRFDADGRKLGDKVVCNPEVDLSHCLASVSNAKTKTKYRLCAAACHAGRHASSGHYFATVVGKGGSMHVINDESCHPINSVLDAYLVFYTRAA